MKIRNMNSGDVIHAILALFVLGALNVAPVAALTPTPTPSPTPTSTPCPEGCSGPAGSITVSGPTVEPLNPLVGDDVVFTFPVTASGLAFGFSCGCSFVAEGDYLEGEGVEYDGDVVTVRRHVVRAGATTVQLNVSSTSEEECFTEDELGCRSFFSIATVSGSSTPLEVVFSENSSGGGGGGCAIEPREEQRSMELILGVLLVAAWVLHRARG